MLTFAASKYVEHLKENQHLLKEFKNIKKLKQCPFIKRHPVIFLFSEELTPKIEKFNLLLERQQQKIQALFQGINPGYIFAHLDFELQITAERNKLMCDLYKKYKIDLKNYTKEHFEILNEKLVADDLITHTTLKDSDFINDNLNDIFPRFKKCFYTVNQILLNLNTYLEEFLTKRAYSKGLTPDAFLKVLEWVTHYKTTSRRKVDPSTFEALRFLTVKDNDLPTTVYRGMFLEKSKVKKEPKKGDIIKIPQFKASSWSPDIQTALSFMDRQSTNLEDGYPILLKYDIKSKNDIVADLKNLGTASLLEYYNQYEILLSPEINEFEILEVGELNQKDTQELKEKHVKNYVDQLESLPKFYTITTTLLNLKSAKTLPKNLQQFYKGLITTKVKDIPETPNVFNQQIDHVPYPFYSLLYLLLHHYNGRTKEKVKINFNSPTTAKINHRRCILNEYEVNEKFDSFKHLKNLKPFLQSNNSKKGIAFSFDAEIEYLKCENLLFHFRINLKRLELIEDFVNKYDDSPSITAYMEENAHELIPEVILYKLCSHEVKGGIILH